MKVVVFSDTHGKNRFLKQIIEKEMPDAIVHLGDGWNDLSLFPNPLYQVRGNCDIVCELPDERCIELEGVHLFLTHGHRYQVKRDLNRLVYAALEQNADVILFGHTHVPYFEKLSTGLFILNPGSLTTYGVMEIGKGELNINIRDIF